jgi:hypothetical protein
MSMVDAALVYASRGLAVLPLVPKGKLPLAGTGVFKATTDTSQIEEWWQDCPDANIAVATGEASKLVVVDVDPVGQAWWQDFVAKHPEVADTAHSVTGRGHHYWYRLPEGMRFASTAGHVQKGIDTRGESGYVVAPPSMHENGKRYEWANDVAAAELPAILQTLLKEQRVSATSTNADVTVQKTSPEELKRFRSALDDLAQWRCDDRDMWIAVGMASRQHGDDGLQMWTEWSRKSPKFKEGECEVLWPTFFPIPENGRRPASIFYWAKQDRSERVRQEYEKELEEFWGPDYGRANPETPQPVAWLVEKILPENSLVLVYGAPGVGKSMVVMDMAVAVAAGTPWLPSQVEGKTSFPGYATQQAGILWIDLDQGSEILLERIGAMRRGIGGRMAKIDVRYPPKGLDLSDTGHLDDLVLRIRMSGSRLVVIDTFGRLIGDIDENDAQVDRILAGLRQVVQETGVTIILIHHSNKGNENGVARARGSTAIVGGVDVAFEVHGARDEGDGFAARIKTQKSRRAKHGEIHFVLKPTKDENGNTLTLRCYKQPDNAKTRSDTGTSKADGHAFLRKWVGENQSGELPITQSRASQALRSGLRIGKRVADGIIKEALSGPNAYLVNKKSKGQGGWDLALKDDTSS